MTLEEAIQRMEQARLDRERAMNRIVLTVERAAKKRTPVDTGTLRRSITHRVEASGERGVVGTNIQYSRFVHEGTSRMKARPYLEEGLRDSDTDIKQIIDDLGKGYLEEIVS